MQYTNANDPYKQPEIPYQPYEGRNTQMQPPQPKNRPQYAQNKRVPAYPTQARIKQTKPVTLRKSKAETLSFVHECKKWLLAGSIVTFGLMGGLVAGHAVGTSSNQATPANNTPPSTSPSTNGGNDGNGGFFNQQPGQQQQQGGGGYGFGNNNTPSQPPVSGSQTS